MASWSKALLSSALNPSSLFSSHPRHSLNSSFSLGGIKLTVPFTYPSISKTQPTAFPLSFSFQKHICRAVEYKFPDPIPEFADAVSSLIPILSFKCFLLGELIYFWVQETDKFKTHLLNKLAKKDMFGDSLEEVVGICTEVMSSSILFNVMLVQDFNLSINR